ncbi:hypothetical protein FRZ61_09270 [Hypericibacter adhaerens]|uniref:Uncharacterized protein n=1 Tax=Hypericibacter adhaerens TaxID=2602016 RepID=A0A5J6MUZ4_9PROT|nr:DUF6111 family protein [Hypericibacter adhaerens]QEX21007.1 hypothetical protein FRZ61_09270 [Hypericibacter adhaerens]
MRRFLEILIPLLLPTAIYFVYVAIARRQARAAGASPTVGLRDMPWTWLAGAGVALLAVTLAASAFFGGAPPGSHYEPPSLEDGQIKQGGFSE